MRLGVLFALLIAVGFSENMEASENRLAHEHDQSHDHGQSRHQDLNLNPRDDIAQELDMNHDHTPHMGILTSFRSPEAHAGFAELKLHEDKGDLELWLTKDQSGTMPFDVPLNTVITVSISKMEPAAVKLRVRNNENNEDEEGVGNIRNNKTNYFIFPSKAGEDASFLVGKDFLAEVIISFAADGDTYTTAPFELRPHTH